MKKCLSFLLCATMILIMAGCGGTDTADKTADADKKESVTQQEGAGVIDFDEDPYVLNICYAVMGEAQPDLAMIEEKLNEITLREINVKVKLEAVSLFSLANVYALKASSQEKMDLTLMFPGYNYLTSFANSNMIMPIEEYVDTWGDSIKEVMGGSLRSGEFKEHLYAVPQNKDLRANAWGFNVSSELCEKYDIDPDAIKSIEDLEAAFAVIKENEPNVTVVMPETSGGAIIQGLLNYYDGLGSGGGILEEAKDGSLQVVNQLETDSYMQACEKVREWYEAGYISKDVLTSQDAGSDALSAGKCFAAAVTSIGPKDDYFYKSVVLLDEIPLITTQNDQMLLWGVAATCERPDKAIQFLNMCFESEEAANLMMYGIEDVHYNVLENGTIDISSNEGWQNYWNMFGDYNKEYITDNLLKAMPEAETVEDYRKIMDEWKMEESAAYGFNFDPTNVKTEIAACDAVNNEYQLVIGNGTVDPKVEMKKWIDKLYDAGLQKVIDEKQVQLDTWGKSQK